MADEFKSYYVVWKQIHIFFFLFFEFRLNRTM